MKEIREVLGLLEAHAVAQHHGKLTSYGVYGIDQAEAEIKKIVLGWVGSDEDNPCGRDCECSAHSEDECGCGVDWTNNRGKNALRAEIRKKLEGEL